MSPGNDIEFFADDLLYKRLPPELCKDGQATSGIYRKNKKPDPEPSLDLARLTTPEKVMSKAPRIGFGLGSLTVGVVRELGLDVKYQPELGNEAHCILIPAISKIDKQMTRELAVRTITIFPPAEIAPKASS